MTAAISSAMHLCGGSRAVAETKAGLADMTRLAAAEGIVLLRHENETLPLSSDRTISLFGRVQVDTFACGYGSGGDVKTPYTINILEALRRHPTIRVNESLAEVYEGWCMRNPPDNGSWGSWPLNHAEMELEDKVVAAAAAASDTAVVVIGRSSGEDREAKLEAGSYYLTASEIDLLDRVNKHFGRVVVLLNAGSIFDMSWIERYEHIDSVLHIWQGGMQGSVGLADVLSGDLSPSGKLTATIAAQYTDYPTSGESGGEKIFGGWNFSNYVEDIYVGYRYFESFAPDKVLFPFGYGLSYTEFDIETQKVTESEGIITLNVSVKNTGSTYTGKEVVQVYYGAPQGKLGKAVKSLAAYAKTRALAPGETEDIQLSFMVDDMASYDDSGATGNKSSFVMEAGEYPIYVGNSVREATRVGAYGEKRLRVTQRLSEVAPVAPDAGFKRMKATLNRQGALSVTYEDVPTRTASLADRIEKDLPQKISQTSDRGIKLIDVSNGRSTLEKFVAQLSPEELEALCRGDFNMGSGLGAPGNAAVFGGVSDSLRAKGVAPVTAVDGPSGIRLTAAASLLPIGNALACSWNDGLVEELYAMVGHEMRMNGADVLLAPGMNIQRDPLCGRNFEYFSEDPLLTGRMGANVVRGLQSEGVSATPKHFGLNNQETRRNVHDSRCSERAIREIYVKAFEICLKTTKPRNLMASYNKINGVYSHYHYDLFTSILRDEWGYEGVVMTDWWIKPGTSPDNEKIYDNAYRVRAQVDVLMPGEGPIDGANDRSLLNSYETGKGITLGEMQRSAVNTLKYVMQSPSFRTANGLELCEADAGERWFSVQQDAVVKPQLAQLSLDGKPLKSFDPKVLDYEIYTPKGTQPAAWSAVPAAGCELEIIDADEDGRIATIKVSNAKAHALYRVYFTNKAGLEPIVDNATYAELTALRVNGEELRMFYPKEKNYRVVVAHLNEVEITADVPEGVSYTVTKTKQGDRAIVRAESPHHAMDYEILLVEGDPAAEVAIRTIDVVRTQGTRLQAEDFMYKSEPIGEQHCEDVDGGMNVGWTAAGSYMLYAIHVEQSGWYTVSPRVASDADSLTQLSYNLEVDGEVVASYVHGGTGGWQSWRSMEPKRIFLEEGDHKLRVYFLSSDVNMNYLEFNPAPIELGDA